MKNKFKDCFTYIFLIITLFSLGLIYGCDNGGENPHNHNFVEGKCECGESDPNYIPPHNHNFVNGICDCGEKDPLYVQTELTYEEALEIYNTFEANIPSLVYLGDKLTLPNEVNGYQITYSFDQPKYINENLEVVFVEQVRNRAVTLSTKIGNSTFTKKITIHQDLETYFNKVSDFLDDAIPQGVNSQDINFYTSYPGDKEIIIQYRSLNPEFVSNEGKHISHEYDEEVGIELILTKHGHSFSKVFEYTSMGITYAARYEKWTEYINDFFENTELLEGTKLPTELPLYGGRIRWVAEDPMLVYDYTTLHLPKESKTTHLMAEVRFGSTEYHWEVYEVQLNARPSNITDLDYVLSFIETVSKTADDYLVLYDGTVADINKDYIVDENIKEVVYEKYSSTIRPEVPQETLDRLMYEGYVMPNEENILWVVVHETGMSYAGKDALLLAELQYNQAYRDNGRDASWGYTVDEHSIYQSFPDTYLLWHATDGRTPGAGNANGIGVEMCVNSDGIYDVSMKNNARLMAGLLIKYNLGMMNMKQHSNFYEYKSCPEIMIRTYRWYEYLTLIAREYISQKILSNFEISYSVNLNEMQTKGVYDCTQLNDGDNVEVIATINGEEHIFNVVINK